MKAGRAEDVLDWLKPGSKVFFQGGPGECQALIALLKANPGATEGVELWSCLIPGINTFDYGSLPDGPTLVTFMASPTLAPSIATGRTRIDAMSYSEIGVTLGQASFDLAILHVAPPDAEGLCSFGVSAEVGRIVSPSAKQCIAFINARMPNVAGDALAADDIDLAIEIDEPLLAATAPSRSAAADALARYAAALVPEYATIQSGIGEAPGAIVAALTDHRRLRIHSGLVTPEYRLLAKSGALDPDRYHVAGIAWGDADFYDWLPDSEITFRSVRETHFHERLAAIPNFVSIGSALEVDLEGAINLEWLGERRVSSVGGAPDFMRGAAASPGGRSIIALPSTDPVGRIPHSAATAVAIDRRRAHRCGRHRARRRRTSRSVSACAR